MAIRSFRDLLVWQKSMDLARRCYLASNRLPSRDQFVLGYQLRRSSVSIPSNVAEGFSRHSKASYVNHLWIACSFAAELETQVELGQGLKLLDDPSAETLIRDTQEIRRMISGLVASLERTTSEP
jgi:four helix bundle protein